MLEASCRIICNWMNLVLNELPILFMGPCFGAVHQLRNNVHYENNSFSHHILCWTLPPPVSLMLSWWAQKGGTKVFLKLHVMLENILEGGLNCLHFKCFQITDYKVDYCQDDWYGHNGFRRVALTFFWIAWKKSIEGFLRCLYLKMFPNFWIEVNPNSGMREGM